MPLLYKILFTICVALTLKITAGQSTNLVISNIETSNETTLKFLVELKNISNDSIILASSYFQFNLEFIDSSIIRSRQTISQISYPESNYDALNSYEQQQIIINHCRPLIDEEQFVILGPGDLHILTYDLSNASYSGFQTEIDYKFSLTLSVSEKLKLFCPLIWTGKLLCNDKININQ